MVAIYTWTCDVSLLLCVYGRWKVVCREKKSYGNWLWNYDDRLSCTISEIWRVTGRM